jgi:hypothetical protein
MAQYQQFWARFDPLASDCCAAKPRCSIWMWKTRAGRIPMSKEDWRIETLSRIRRLIEQADPDVTESVKWRKPSNPGGVPVWEHDGMICRAETYKDKVKLTFAKGAALPDPSRLFNSSLEGNTRRAIDIPEGQMIDEAALKTLIRAAVDLNRSK